jgi:phage replication-related protein YjqB (UPF0714/DUF867 family)
MYESFEALRECEKEGMDFLICVRPGRTGITVMAPHGGEIEPGTSEIARAIAGSEHGFYAFEGHKPRNNMMLHLTSTHFDEPLGTRIAGESRLVLTIHGCHNDREIIYFGGRCGAMLERALEVFTECGFVVAVHQKLKGQQASNLCNRNLNGKGVQVEISSGLRRTLFRDLTPQGRQHTTERFLCFVEAMREVLLWAPGNEPQHSSGAPATQGS